MWILAGLLANFGIMWVEYVNRAGGHGGFLSTLPYTIVPIAIAQYGLYYSWSHAPSMMQAWIFFTVGNNLLRVANAYFVGEPVNAFTGAGISLALAAACLIKHGSNVGV